MRSDERSSQSLNSNPIDPSPWSHLMVSELWLVCWERSVIMHPQAVTSEELRWEFEMSASVWPGLDMVWVDLVTPALNWLLTHCY